MINSLTINFYKNSLKIFSIFNIQNKIPIIVILVLFSTLLELLGIGMLIPIASILFETDSEINRQILSFLPTSFHSENSLQIFLYIFLLIFVLKNLILVFIEYYKANYFHKVYLKILNNFYTFYLNTPLKFFFKKNSSKIIDILINRVDQFISTLQAFTNLLSELVLTLGILILLLSISSLSAISIILILIIAGVIYLKILKKKLINYGRIRDENLANYIKHTSETLNFIREIKIFNILKYFEKIEKFNSKSFIFAKKNITFINGIGRNFFEIIAVLSIFLVLLFLSEDEASIVKLLPLITIYLAGAIKILPSINRISHGIQNININFNVTESIVAEILSLKNNQLKYKIERNKDNLEFNKEIKIKNLSFSYNYQKTILKNLNFDIKKGECVAIVGKSGSGKSSLLEVLCGFLEPSKGEVLIDDKNLLDYREEWLNIIGYVTQETFILDDTLKKNIALFDLETKNINEKKVNDSLKKTNLYNFFNNEKDGLDTILNERGKTISGGQKQRINIARNLYKNPKIIFFDEPTSALDEKTSDDIIDQLKKIKNSCTILIVTHDKKIMNFCDKIINLDDLNARI